MKRQYFVCKVEVLYCRNLSEKRIYFLPLKIIQVISDKEKVSIHYSSET